MALQTYLDQTKQLLQLPEAPEPLYPDDLLTLFINRARKQLAGESEAIRALGTIPTVADQRPYNFTDISTGVSAATGISGPVQVRSIMYAVGDGQQMMRGRPWPWFQLFKLNNVVPNSGPPEVWSQYHQGAAGSFYVDPIPDGVYTLTCDTVCLPIDLVDDTTVEAIPELWQDAVCYFAAYLALLSAQSAQRQADADRMIARYTEFADRARRFSTPEVNRSMYPQSPDATLINKLGVSPKALGGGNAQ